MGSGLLLIVCGPSGVGKTTLARRLMDEFAELTFSVSYTTRGPRRGEQDGVHYHFVDSSRFEQMRAADEFAESADVHGNSYGTAIATIEGAWEAGRHVIFDIDYQGARQLQHRYPTETVSVLITPPNLDELARRLRGRATDRADVIERRLAAAAHELSQWRLYDFVVENDELERAYEQLRSIWKAAQCRTTRHAASLAQRFGDAASEE